MKFTELRLKGAYLIELEPHYDDRGSFTRLFCCKEFEKLGLVNNFVQISTAFNKQKGQVRGMHFQASPFSETKLIRCISGAVRDVIVDLREDSKTYNQWVGVELSAQNHNVLYVPKNFAHGYKTIEDNTELLYLMDEFYHPEAACEISCSDLYWVENFN